MTSSTPSPAGIVVASAHLRALVENSREPMFLAGADGKVLYASTETCRALRYSAQEVIGASVFDWIHREDLGRARDLMGKVLARPGEVECASLRLRCGDGTHRYFEFRGRNLLQDASVQALVVHFRDVTEEHRNDAERQVISEITHALNQTHNLDALLLHIHQALKKVVFAENCFIALHDRETASFHCPYFIDQVDVPPPAHKVGRSCAAHVFRTGRAILMTKKVLEGLVASGEVELIGTPAAAWLGVPLKTPDETIGVLVVQHYSDESAYDQRDLEFLDSVGGHMALAIERKRAEDTLHSNEARFRLLFSHNPLPTWVLDKQTHNFLQVNRAAVDQYGYSTDEFLAMRVTALCPEGVSDFLQQFENDFELARRGITHKHRRKDGKLIDVEVSALDLEYGGHPAVLVVAQDSTDRRLLEAQFRQAQKMEAVGRLAGGVAHDFNNLLMVIKGHTELLLQRHANSEEDVRRIEQIARAADRAEALTRQLLAFSRRQVLQPTIINLNDIIHEIGKLLPRLIGEDVELVVRTAPDLKAVRADAIQMEQVVMNLAVNSRDAMPQGGRFIIETANAEVDRIYAAMHPQMTPGSYVLLAVSDNGSGMDAETQARIFEPFFTTKEQGKGTGLGLATVYGIIKQSGGFIWVYSEVGKGTTFKIYLPRVDQPTQKLSAGAEAQTLPRGSETVLLVEDEEDVREIAREFLKLGGYNVLEAKDGPEGLDIAQRYPDPIHLLVSDMIMPGMNGSELAAKLSVMRPDLKIVFTSGYTEYAAECSGEWDASCILLAKPFTRSAILRAVRDALEGRKHS
jgi:two-component system, cell cycle sensor histidine kinase and response regulator CckA